MDYNSRLHKFRGRQSLSSIEIWRQGTHFSLFPFPRTIVPDSTKTHEKFTMNKTLTSKIENWFNQAIWLIIQIFYTVIILEYWCVGGYFMSIILVLLLLQ